MYASYFSQVNVPKGKKTFCKKCNKHSAHKVTQYKTGKASLYAQGEQQGPEWSRVCGGDAASPPFGGESATAYDSAVFTIAVVGVNCGFRRGFAACIPYY